MRLIDADALKKRLQEQQKYGSVQDSRGRAKAIVEVIHAPTIDAEPVRHGQWENPTESKPRMFERYGHTFIERQCTECERWSIQVAGSITYKFCPHCGVKMKRGEDNA